MEYLLKRAFKAGGPKWHKVADGDLPEEDTEVLNDNGVEDEDEGDN